MRRALCAPRQRVLAAAPRHAGAARRGPADLRRAVAHPPGAAARCPVGGQRPAGLVPAAGRPGRVSAGARWRSPRPPSPATEAVSGGRALYDGLTKIGFSGEPVTIVSSGLDLANPDDFRSLKWSVPAGELVAELTKAGDLPALHGPVTFVLVPTTGRQP